MEIIHKHPLHLGEGPLWDERLQALFFVDIMSKKFYVWHAKTNESTGYTFEEYISCLAFTQDPNVIHIALESGIYTFNLETSEKKFISQPEQQANYRYNDGAVDPYGNWLLGSMNNVNNGAGATLQPDATLYHIQGATSRALLTGVTISNGIVFKDGSLYFIDSKLNTVRKFPYDGENLGTAETIFTLTDGTTLDGMTLSKSGKLYIANWGGSKILIFDLDTQKIVGDIPVPALNPTSCTFGGPEFNELYITTSAIDDPNPALAGVYRIKLEDSGFPEHKLK
ncbi:SMP-30/gluconolactonase/LRE family protein [Sphingobacterium sp. Mn56C]|uniref:SMP-30/gluconolactonase/LRE family protein n=1 Tax=Sphingobacterium sp. Mn56C TaxID=3395261 RepID=UPI003BBC1985